MSTDFNPFHATPTYEGMSKYFTQFTGNRPLVASALVTLLAGLGAGAVGPAVARRLVKAPEMTPDVESRIRRRFRVAGALAGASIAAPVMYQHIKEKGWGGLFKPSSLRKEAVFVPVSSSLQIIQGDSFIPDNEKAFLHSIFNEAGMQAGLRYGPQGKLQGLLRTEDLIGGAIGAGLGYGGGLLTGTVLSKIFALPPSIVRRASRAGTLAGALYGTGIIS